MAPHSYLSFLVHLRLSNISFLCNLRFLVYKHFSVSFAHFFHWIAYIFHVRLEFFHTLNTKSLLVTVATNTVYDF